jgi:presenilin-like A22 family membrane protease
MLFGILFSYLISTSQIEPVPVTPFSQDAVGALATATYFVVLVGIGATLLYLLLRKRNLRLITFITGFAMTVAVFALSLIYLYAGFSRFEVFYGDVFIFVLSVVVTVSVDYVFFVSHSRYSNLMVLVIGGGLGAFLGFSLPTQSTILILSFLAVYDTFAVYRGPVGKIARSGLEQFRGLSFSFRDMQMGLGDLTFYSMLSGHMFVYFGFVACVASVIGIIFGCLVSFKMLEKKGMFPGLPFPVLFGLTAGLLATLIG